MGWGVEDVALFVGDKGREINEIDDLTADEGRTFLKTNFSIIEHLLDTGQAESAQVTIGFNAQDFSVGHHSVLKLHSHVRATPHEFDLERRKQFSWRELRRFDRMSFIEPFAPLYHDYIEHEVRSGLFKSLAIGLPQRMVGFTSIDLARVEDLSIVFNDLKALYKGMKAEYDSIADIFTDKTVDRATGRYVPYPGDVRYLRLEEFLASRPGFYSDTAVQILQYLASNIKQAERRDPENPFDMSPTTKLYASRGFAGAMTFGFERDEDVVRFEFFPRVITSSGAVKTIMGKDLPTVIDRIDTPVSEEEAQITRSYHHKIVDFLLRQGAVQL